MRRGLLGGVLVILASLAVAEAADAHRIKLGKVRAVSFAVFDNTLQCFDAPATARGSGERAMPPALRDRAAVISQVGMDHSNRTGET